MVGQEASQRALGPADTVISTMLSAVELVRPPLLLRVGVLYALALVTRKMFGPTACVTICRYMLRRTFIIKKFKNAHNYYYIEL